MLVEHHTSIVDRLPLGMVRSLFETKINGWFYFPDSRWIEVTINVGNICVGPGRNRKSNQCMVTTENIPS